MASDVRVETISIPAHVWARLVLRLRRQSGGIRESGAFLLGPQDGAPRVRTYVCYDALDPDAYESGAISFHACGYVALSSLCRRKKLQVLADVHTHPGDSVRQSPTDRENPMLPIVGHTALIVPRFARVPSWSLAGVGVYEYLGNFTWRSHSGPAAHRVAITFW